MFNVPDFQITMPEDGVGSTQNVYSFMDDRDIEVKST
jgi:hypothetical protein